MAGYPLRTNQATPFSAGSTTNLSSIIDGSGKFCLVLRMILDYCLGLDRTKLLIDAYQPMLCVGKL
ncbi:hypothetical protein FBU30_003373 [Linnemannia zychae]|nr:hypothetical protein FBU30_003373 [Linnemannia zychae]